MTTIEWTDETWNPVTGCSKVSQGCKNCYAERLWPKVEAAERMRLHFDWQKVTPRAFTDVHSHPNRLATPLHWKKPRRIFVNSMSDLFHEDVQDEFIDQVFAVMAAAEQHTFQILTKRPERMRTYLCSNGRAYRVHDALQRLCSTLDDGTVPAKLDPIGKRRWIVPRPLWAQAPAFPTGMPWPLPNVWLGVSVEDQATADERIPLLLQTPAAVRFISAEPLLGPIDLRQACNKFRWTDPDGVECCGVTRNIGWVIAGGESGPKARPSHPDWFRSLRDQCAAAGVPYFFKQWGEWWEVGHELSDGGKAVVVDVESSEAEKWCEAGDKLVAVDGRVFDAPQDIPDDTPCRLMTRLGKKAAGRTLDGRTHDEYPEAQS